mmetsp:Transcript_9633/g.12584  ORF Transcript_9633/g.12584 Transcript_9633/m.12584 type:complete len:500 (-) Transcript_9633:112-1611(-)
MAENETAVCRLYNEYREVTDTKRFLNLSWFLLQEFYYVFFIIVYVRRRKVSKFLQKRARNVETISCCLGAMYTPIFISLSEYIGPQKFACFWLNFNYVIGLCFVAFVNVMRLFAHYYRVEMHRAIAEKKYYEILKSDIYYDADIPSLLLEKGLEHGNFKGSKSNNPTEKLRSSSFESNVESTATAAMSKDTKESTDRRVKRLRMFASPAFGWFVTFVHLGVVVVGFGLPFEDGQYQLACCGGESLSLGIILFVTGYCIFLSILTIVAVSRLKNEPDPFKILREFDLSYCGLIFLALFLLFAASDFGTDLVKRDNSPFLGTHFIEIAFIIWFTIWIPIPIRWSYAYDAQSENDNRKSQFESFIYNKTTERDLFIAYLASELSVESYYFLKETKDWKEMSLDSPERIAQAIQIYRTFIETESLLEVNISGTVKEDLKQVFVVLQEHMDTELPPTLFDAAVSQVSNILSAGPFERYLNKNPDGLELSAGGRGEALVLSHSAF